jgi:hypothetical protein
MRSLLVVVAASSLLTGCYAAVRPQPVYVQPAYVQQQPVYTTYQQPYANQYGTTVYAAPPAAQVYVAPGRGYYGGGNPYSRPAVGPVSAPPPAYGRPSAGPVRQAPPPARSAPPARGAVRVR